MKLLKIIIVSFIFALPLSAHPHMLVHTQSTLDFTNGQVGGIWVQFEFDRFFSGEVIWGYDEDRNGVFDERESEYLYENVFSNFADFNYFTFIRIGSKRILPDHVEDFSAWCKGNEILFFRFYIPLESFTSRDFYIAIYDSSFFCACRLNEEDPMNSTTEDFFHTEGTEIPDVTVSVEKNEDYPVYYDPSAPASDLTTYDSWKPGLQTFIPEEIHVQF